MITFTLQSIGPWFVSGMVLLSWPGCLTATQRTFLKAGACRLSQEWPAGSARGHHDTRSPPEIAEYKPCKGESARRVSPSLQSASRRETVFSNLLWVAVKQSDSDSDTLALSDQETPATPESTAAPEPLSKELSPEEKAALAEGQALFRGLCSGCHGGLGRGGKGPDLTDNRWLHGDKDEDIQRVIQNGVPGTTMKKLGESLKDQQIARIIAYVRSLARAPGDNKWKPYMAGDPQAGEQLFFDDMSKTPCAKCHTVNRKGGRLGPTLDRIAARRSPEFIMESIVTPSKFIDPLFEAVSVATRDGKVIVGLRIQETNFSIQLREENGRFHSLLKRDLDEFRVMDKSLMPENIPDQLTVKQLHDLFAFLMTLE